MKPVLVICSLVLVLLHIPQALAQTPDSVASVSLLALGDINLGRMVGQEILKGKLDYPFEKFMNVLTRADFVFANLECPVTDQNGETQDPKSNVVFCAPPDAAASLRRAGVTVVSTANNHAFDYGLKGLLETIKFLRQDSIRFVGTVADSGAEYTPIIIEHNGISIGLVAYTQFVNIQGPWKGMISVFDTARARLEIGLLKKKVDFVLVSYHGGDEYKETPGNAAEQEMKFLAEYGVDIVLGHHPHVPLGIEVYHGCFIFQSLGNTVFNQPQLFWTQRSYAVLVGFEKRNGEKKLSSIELIPFRPGFQPQTNLNNVDTQKLVNRIQKLSTVIITHTERGTFVESSITSTSR